jgi:putative membrane protein
MRAANVGAPEGECMVRAPYVGLAIVSAIALGVVPPVRAQTLVDPGRSPDAAFVAKALDAAAVDAELAALAMTRATATGVKTFAKQVLDTRTVLARELAAMGRTSPIAGAPRAEPKSDAAPTKDAHDGARADAPLPDAMKAVASLRSQPPRAFDAAFIAAMIASREAAVAMFEAESRDGRDAEVKEWAARQLPALRDQLVAARALRPRPSS